jgi:hypothetical protein
VQISLKEYNDLKGEVLAAQQVAKEGEAQIAGLIVERDRFKKDYENASAQNRERSEELSRLQRFLSNLPDPPPIRGEGEESWKPELPPVERLAIWITKRMK